jgi:hypothetical protein
MVLTRVCVFFFSIMMTAEALPAAEQEFFDPLYQIQIPNAELDDLIAAQDTLSDEQLVARYNTITERITHWLETAHMIAFTIEQSVKRGDIELHTVEPLELSCQKMQPLIQQLAEYVDDQDQLGSPSCKLKLTKIQSEWSGLQHFISFVKNLIDAANEKYMLRTLMENILLQVDDLSIMIFQFQEKRHLTAATVIEVDEQSKKEDGILLEIDNRVGPLFNNVEKVYTRMTSATPPEDSTGLLTRKHLLVQERWECLRVEIDELKIELKEDRWLVVFRQVADQVDEMMNGLDKTVTQCYAMIQQIKESGTLVTSSSSTTSTSSTSSTNSTNQHADLRTKLRSVEKNFEAKYKYYTPSIAKMLMMLGNGIAARVSRNVATLQRHEAMLTRWNTLKCSMDQLRKRDLPDIVVVESTTSDHTSNTGCWSRLSDRSDSTTGSMSNWKDLLPPNMSASNVQRFLHNKSSSPSLIDEPTMEFARSRSPYSKLNHHSSPSPLFMDEKSRRTPQQPDLWRAASPSGRRNASPASITSPNSIGRKASRTDSPIGVGRNASPSSMRRTDSPSGVGRNASPSSIRRTDSPSGVRRNASPSNMRRTDSPSGVRRNASPINATPNGMRRTDSPNSKRTTSPPIYAREAFSSVGSALRPSSISPSHSQRTFRTDLQSRYEEEDEEDDTISTKDFRKLRSKSSLSNAYATQRSMTPSLRRSGTPSMIPRPKTPTNKPVISESMRPRSSMARITSTTTKPFRYKPDPKDPLDKQVAAIVNRSPIPIQCSKKQGSGDGRYYFGNELTPSLGGGKKIYTCKLMTYENSGRNKVLIRVGGGWQDLEIFLLEHMNLIG